MDAAFLTLEEVLLRIVEKLPHAAEAELTHLKASIHNGFHTETPESASVTETAPVTESENSNGSADNPPVA